jgi:tRNA (mo5U34)-methyltransferase
MDAPEKQQRATEFTWYHTVDLGDGVVTDGQYDHRPLLRHYGLPERLDGKTVLDVGPAHGFFAFELESRGASRVATLELPRWSAHDVSPELRQSFADENRDDSSLTYLHGALRFAIESRGSSVEQHFGSVYNLDPDEIGTFDVVFCASVLLHVSDPIRALWAIHSVTREYAIIVTSVYRPRLSRHSGVARFTGRVDGQTFWEPDMACLTKWILAAGFERVEEISQFELASLDGQFKDWQGAVRAYVR